MEQSDKRQIDGDIFHPVKIGSLSLPGNIFLAPMAGVTDLPFRLICKAYGASFAYTEMISAKGVHYKSAASFELALSVPEEQPAGVQLFGSEPDIMAEAAKIFADRGAPLIDINMGCPMRKITGNGEGSALMRDPGLIARITEAVKKAVDVPVTVKLRRGFDTGDETCVQCGIAAVNAGADALTVHGRFREEYYSGLSDWTAVRRVKEAVSVPVFLSGDVTDNRSAKEAFTVSGADGVMIGRAAMGNPWIFGIVTGSRGLPTAEERGRTVREHLQLLRRFKGDRTASSEFRKHAIWYMKGLRGSAKIRDMICKTEEPEEIEEIIDSFFTALTLSKNI